MEDQARGGAHVQETMLEVAEAVFGQKKPTPKRPWIKDDTLQLLQQRADLLGQGRPTEAEAMCKEIKKSARNNRRQW
eukprot:625568-Alexandrium_andersonii.AAC.1